MADTRTPMRNDQKSSSDWQDDRQRQDRDRSPRIITSTEARRAFTTTEFWLTIVAVVAMVVTGYANDDGLRVDTAWMLSAGVIAAYLISRGIAKAGSSDPVTRSLDDL